MILINDKKVYRLMDENNLLLGKVIRSRGKREFAKHRRIDATYPMEFICMDIRYIWVDGKEEIIFYSLSLMYLPARHSNRSSRQALDTLTSLIYCGK